MRARRRRGFERLGAAGVRALGLPAPRARQLMLADAWGRAAGEALAARARAIRADRGVLEIEVPERRWAEALAGTLRDLAAQTAALAPGLSIRSLRVLLPDGTEALAAAPLGEAPGPSPERGPAPGRHDTRAEVPRADRGGTNVTSPEGIERLRDRYLERSRKRRRDRD